MKFALIALSLRCPQTKSVPVIFGKEGTRKYHLIWVENRISQKINGYCLIMWPMALYFPHTLRTRWLFQDTVFSCRVCSAPSWDSDDASFIEPKSSPEQRLINCLVPQGTSIMLCNAVLQTQSILWCCIMAKLKIWTSYALKLKKKSPLWQWDCWDVVSELTIKLSAQNTLSL